ncbi:MAG: heterodisulfide reductase, partial [Deltaproteobacteria bacterium]
EYKPTEYLYGEDERVLTLLELEERIAKGDEGVTQAQTVVMIQCVGCRNEERSYCSRVCCSQAVKNALKLKEIKPDIDIYVLYRDMRTYGFREDYYREAADRGVIFIRYEPDEKPQVERVEEGGKTFLRVTVTEPTLGMPLAIDADILALAAAVVPSAGAERISQLFKVPLNQDGFFKEAHVKLRPVEFDTEGVYLCGTAHYPKHIQEVINQAYGAAGRALALLSHDTVIASGVVAQVQEERCIGCGTCVQVCAYSAVELRETKQGKKATVNPIICKGDGLCNAVCPSGAISLKHFTDEEIGQQIDVAFAAM